MDELRVSVDNGKYTIVMPETGGLHCLRYGEEWRNLTGDGMVLAMAYEIDRLRDALRPFAVAAEFIERFDHIHGDLYVAVKNDGVGNGWSYPCSGVGCSDLDRAKEALR